MADIKNIETKRLILRPWRESDAETLYEFAKNPLIGPAAGWPVHPSVENSRIIIRDVLSAKETYAVTLKGNDTAIGSIGLLIGDKSNLKIKANEAEIGYWIAQPYWGQGLIPEAARELIHYAFETLGLSVLWCGYFDGNEKSKRVNEKCGFRFHHTEYDKEWPLINAVKTQHVTRLVSMTAI
jgi:RimJ/RimL family protein N-acetyltransferase